MTNQIKTITLSTGTWVLVEVEPQWKDFEYYPAYKKAPPMIDFFKMDGAASSGEIELPAGHTYTLIGKASELTHEQWEKIIPDDLNIFWAEYILLKYKDYTGEYAGHSQANLSGKSLLKSQGMDIETTVILKQQ